MLANAKEDKGSPLAWLLRDNDPRHHSNEAEDVQTCLNQM